jgi:hypothetical protein
MCKQTVNLHGLFPSNQATELQPITAADPLANSRLNGKLFPNEENAEWHQSGNLVMSFLIIKTAHHCKGRHSELSLA